jgi:ABC-type methionine transport system permease subunit
MTFPHAGIRIDYLPAEEGGGLIFALGTVAIFLVGVPAFAPALGLAALGGLALAPVLHRLYR